MRASSARDLRQVFGLMGWGNVVLADLLGAASQARSPVRFAPFVPNYRCGAAPECALDARSPDSLFSPPIGVGTEDGHKILWIGIGVNGAG